MYRKPHPIHEANAFSKNEMSRHGQDMSENPRPTRPEKCSPVLRLADIVPSIIQPQKTRARLVRIYVVLNGQPIECNLSEICLHTRAEHEHTSPRSRVTHSRHLRSA